MLTGRCNCGAVTIRLQRQPDYVNFCNCTLCRRAGAAWGYYDSAEVTFSGPTAEFGRSDIRRELTLHFCPECGSATHWAGWPDPEGRIGVNMRLFDVADLEGVEAHYSDGLSCTDDDARAPRMAYGKMGDPTSF